LLIGNSKPNSKEFIVHSKFKTKFKKPKFIGKKAIQNHKEDKSESISSKIRLSEKEVLLIEDACREQN